MKKLDDPSPFFHSMKKLKCFFIQNTYNRVSTQTHTLTIDTMNQNQNQNQNQNYQEAAAAARYDRSIEQMNAMDAEITEWHTDEDIRNMFRERLAMINNTDGYHTCDRIHHCRTIQMFDPEDWSALFGYNQPVPQYAAGCMSYEQDETGILPYVGSLEVSLLLEENVTPGIHRAVFIVYITPHQQFYDGHLIELDFGEGSNTHLAVNRLFNVDIENGGHAVVQEFTESQILAFLEDDDQANSLLYSYFLDGFNPMRFGDDVAQNDNDDWIRRHECSNVVNVVLHDGVDPVAPVAPVVAAIPPPPPVNDFAAIYRAELGEAYEAYEAYDDYNAYNENYNIWEDIANANANAYAYAVDNNQIIQNHDVNDDDNYARG